MASIVEFRVPVEQFALAQTFEAVPALHVEIERFAAQETDSTIPFVWVTTEDFDAFERALEEDPSVDDFSSLADCGEERFYRMDWVDDVDLVVHLMLEEDSAISSASTNGESWELQVMCPEHQSVSTVYEFCKENGLSLTVDAIYELDGNEGSKHGLTESQHVSLTKAKELGYYDVPRRISLSELSDELDISHQALSERLRRGHANLIDRTLDSNAEIKTETQPGC